MESKVIELTTAADKYKDASYTKQYTPQMAALCALATELLQDVLRLGESPTINGSLQRSEDVLQDAVMTTSRRLSSATWAALARLFSDLSRNATFMEGYIEGQAGLMPDAFADLLRSGEDDARYDIRVAVSKDGKPWVECRQ